MKIISMFLAALVFILLPYVECQAVVVFYDSVCLKDKKIMLKAVTKGKVFTKGGQMVEFFVDGKSIGRSLSGGDGAAFKEFRAEKTGLHKVSVVSGKDKDSGFRLSLKKGAEIVFIDVEGSMFAPMSGKPRKDSLKIIKAIAKRFPVVYLQAGILDIRTLKKLLKENEFTEAPLLPWTGGNVFEEARRTLNDPFLELFRCVIEGLPVFGRLLQFGEMRFSKNFFKQYLQTFLIFNCNFKFFFS